MARVLITGLGGFTGQYVEAELRSAGWDVFGMGSAADARGRVNYRQVDLRDTTALRAWVGEVQPNAVLHLAGIAFVGHGVPTDFYEINLIGTRNLLAAIADMSPNVSCVVLASSANVYGNSSEGVLSERTPMQPANDYAVSKVAMEYMARLWMPVLPLVLLRPFNYTGVGQSENFLLPKIVAHFKRKADAIELGNIDVWRDFSDVRSLAGVYRRLLEVCPRGQLLNFCSGITWSIREILSVMEELSGHSMEIRVNPTLVRANEVRSLCGDPSMLRGVIGEYARYDLKATLRWMLEA